MEGGNIMRNVKDSEIYDNDSINEYKLYESIMIIEFSQAMISWLNKLKLKYLVPKELQIRIEDFKKIIKLKTQEYLERIKYNID